MTRRFLFVLTVAASAMAEDKLRVAIIGLAHGHAGGFLNRGLTRPDAEIVGISEPDGAVRQRYAERYKIAANKLFDSHAKMLDAVKPEAAMVFTSTFDHLEAVELCAARKIPVIMEKPLAVSLDHARAMAAAAQRGGIPVMVNYETTWYPVNEPIWRMIKTEGKLGEVRRIVAHYGHQGPKEIGVQPEFFAWLTDPVKNGAGALFDFGCYGANFATWLFDNQKPISVLAQVHQNKPDIYKKVDDEATIILQYEKAQVVVQPSWNWPYSRKDMEIYGTKGQLITANPKDYRLRVGAGNAAKEEALTAAPLASPEDDVLHYLAAVARGRLKPGGLSGLENNLIVAEILAAARESARTGRLIRLK